MVVAKDRGEVLKWRKAPQDAFKKEVCAWMGKESREAAHHTSALVCTQCVLICP